MKTKDKIYYLVGKAICNLIIYAGFTAMWTAILVYGFIHNTIY